MFLLLRYKNIALKNEEIIKLQHGGKIVRTSIGLIQFGAVPETIKESMAAPEGVPTIFVLPHRLFNLDRGISVSDIEFPLYYNFFVLKRKVKIIGTVDQIEAMRVVLDRKSVV